MGTRWSQNFLIDKNIARKCVESLHLENTEAVLEIGAGRGVLTEILLKKAQRIVAVEIDSALCSYLQEKFGEDRNFTLLQKDFLKVSLNRNPVFQSDDFKIIGNLPYAVVSPILQKFLKWHRWTSAVVMVQKEVGERILAAPGNKDYGILSVSVQSRCHIEKICLVSRHCFRPIPQVESLLLCLSPLAKPIFNQRKEREFFLVVRAGFAHRRKTLLNSLRRFTGLPVSSIKNALEKCGLSFTVRAEMLAPADFKKLSEMLYNS